MLFRHKCEYDISIGHDKMIDYRIDGAVGK